MIKSEKKKHDEYSRRCAALKTADLPERERRAQAQMLRLNFLMWYYKGDLARRLAETRQLFRRRVYAVDIHTHSIFSDGLGTVAENRACAQHCGLDYFFATDHYSVGAKRAVKHWRDASWGQEPCYRRHHIGVLGNARRLPRRENDIADFETARKFAPFAWVPHPVGLYPESWYEAVTVRALRNFPAAFAMEIINGMNKVVRAYDQFDAKAVRIWDQLLSAGKQITALGGSDAHSPDDIGSVWTGVYAERCGAAAIIKALNQGLCFASEASLLDFSIDGRPMGASLRRKKGAQLRLHFRAADAAGIRLVRVITQGRVAREYDVRGKTVCEDNLAIRAAARPAYFRLESIAGDDRRAFSTPIYVEPA